MTLRLQQLSPVIVAIAIFAVPCPAQAQIESADNAAAPPTVQLEAQTAQAGPDATPISPRQASAFRAPRDHEGLFQTVSAALIVSASTDLSVSMYQIGRGNAREAGFGAAWQDSPVMFAVTKSAISAALVYGLQRMHKTRPKSAIVLGLAATAVEGWLTVRSARIGQ
jgi:hypothetical protein